MSSSTTSRARLSYLVVGNMHSPRAKIVRVVTAEGTKDLAVSATAKSRELVDTILSLSPVRVEAYEDDPPTRLVRAADYAPEPEEEEEEEEQPTLAGAGSEKLLVLFAQLLAAAYKDANTAYRESAAMTGAAFKRLTQIAEHHANRAAAAERAATATYNTLLKQSQAMIGLQAKIAGAVDDEDGPSSGSVEKMLLSLVQQRLTKTNGVVANGAPPIAKEPVE